MEISPPHLDFWSHTSASMYQRIKKYYRLAKPISWVFNKKYRRMANAVAYLVSHYRMPFKDALMQLQQEIDHESAEPQKVSR